MYTATQRNNISQLISQYKTYEHAPIVVKNMQYYVSVYMQCHMQSQIVLVHSPV